MEKLLSFFGISFLFFSSICLAEEPTLLNSSDRLTSGPYIGFQGGIGGIDTEKLSSATKATYPNNKEKIDNRGIGRIFAGYFWSKCYMQYGVEVGFVAYEDNTYELNNGGPINYKYEGYAIDLLGVAQFSFENHFNVFGKLGGAYVSQNYEVKSPRINHKKYKLLPEVAVGVGYSFSPNFDINLTYAYVFGNSPKEFTKAGSNVNSEDMYKDVASIDALMLGFVWKFVNIY